jgi:hypothetical protein
MRLGTGSVWPAIVLHTAWNSVILRGFDPVTTGSGAMLWVGESGILTTLALLAAAVVFSRGRWTILREAPKHEGAPLTASLRPWISTNTAAPVAHVVTVSSAKTSVINLAEAALHTS